MGSLQATEAIKVLLGIGTPLAGRLLVYEPLLVVSLFFVVVAILINRIFRRIEAQVPIRR